jgi:hypothetical protein
MSDTQKHISVPKNVLDDSHKIKIKTFLFQLFTIGIRYNNKNPRAKLTSQS